MNIEEQVTSLELSKKLKELGVKQESLWYWWKAGHIFVEEERYAGRQWEKLASALTVTELGELLPRSIDGKWFLRIKPVKNNNDLWEINYIGKKNKDMTFRYSKMDSGIPSILNSFKQPVNNNG